jgi:hypothetical protein
MSVQSVLHALSGIQFESLYRHQLSKTHTRCDPKVLRRVVLKEWKKFSVQWKGSLTTFKKLLSWRAWRSWSNVQTNVLMNEECILKNKNKLCPYKKLSVLYNTCLKTFGSHLVFTLFSSVHRDIKRLIKISHTFSPTYCFPVSSP